jgi:hypothetical protein
MTRATISCIFSFCDQLSAFAFATNATARVANRVLLFGLILFALSLPHSIAASYVSLSLCMVGWIVRDLAAHHFHFTRTPLDWPWVCFAALTVISALASEAPAISLPKARAILIFGVLYLCRTNLHARAVTFFLGLLLASNLAGIFFSLGEKIIGRGMIVTTIHHDSPLARTQLQVGDVIWMINRQRVSSLADAQSIIAQQRAGQSLNVEALHEGDPLPVEFTVTDELKTRTNALGLNVDGRSRRFRVSGFSRHFLTYAEQMQILGLLAFGWFLAALPRRRVVLLLPLLALFSITLVLTASRAVIASYLLALVLTSLLIASRRVALVTLIVAIGMGGLAASILLSTRTSSALSFGDDSSSRRIGYMKAGLRLIPQHPLLGVGLDAHKQHWREWGFPGEYITHTHSTPIQIAMERGLPALACYVWLMIVLGQWLWREFKRAQNPLAFGALSALLGFSLSSLVNYNFGDSEVVMLLLFLVALATKKRDE